MNYVTAKLITGDTIIGVLVDDHYDQYHIALPMQVKIHSIVVPPNKLVEQLTAAPYTRFTDATTLTLDRQHVVSVQPLNELGVNMYVNLLEEHMEFDQIEAAGIATLITQHIEERDEKKRDEEILANVKASLDIIRSMTEEEPDSNRILH